MTDALRRLALHLGVEPAYHDVDGVRREASAEQLEAVCAALGLPVATERHAAEALEGLLAERRRGVLEPVYPVESGAAASLLAHVPAAGLRAQVVLEDGSAADVRVSASEEHGGAAELDLPPLPPGYHSLLATSPETGEASALLVVAPAVAPQLPGPVWGVFCPWYALADAATGDDAGGFRELARLRDYVASKGGRFVGTLPLYAQFYERPFEPSPYAPVTRLFFNELAANADRDGETRRPGRSAHVDYASAYARARAHLEAEGERAFAGHGVHEIEAYCRRDTHVGPYARFRAECERTGAGWPGWPEGAADRLRREADQGLPGSALADPAMRYHVFAQYVTTNQLEGLGTDRLYLDLPVGVHGGGYDTWRFPSEFALQASAGAPPDTFFAGGQDWGFPPPDPRGTRAAGHRYLRETLRRVMHRAGILRIDHVMGLHRLYWIPRGFGATDGVYVRYPADELAAVAMLEAHRAGVALVGEDLGTVSDEVRTLMDERAVHRSYVLPFEIGADGAPRPAPRRAMASLNTHDMPPFATFWQDAGREALGEWLERTQGADAADATSAMGACLAFLGKTQARAVVVNLEDLWGETRPQNVPGIVSAENWSRRAALSIDELEADATVAATLDEVDRCRRAVE